MISHVTYITYIALLSTHAALQLNQPQSPCSCATEIFHFWLIRIHSNARNPFFSEILNMQINGERGGAPLLLVDRGFATRCSRLDLLAPTN